MCAEPTFTYTFSNLYEDCSEYMGTGRAPTGANLSAAQRRVNSGYRQFIAAHNNWNFLKRNAVLVTESGKWSYDLPDDFASLVYPFKYPPDSSWINPVETDESHIMELRTGSGDTSGRPYLFAIKAKEYAPEEGIRWEVIFHYKPNGVYEMPYTYRITVDELSANGDVPVCGPEHSQTLRTFCLAEVEAFDNEKPGVYITRLAADLANSIRKDSQKSARSVGVMGAVDAGYDRRISVTYNDVQY